MDAIDQKVCSHSLLSLYDHELMYVRIRVRNFEEVGVEFNDLFL